MYLFEVNCKYRPVSLKNILYHLSLSKTFTIVFSFLPPLRPSLLLRVVDIKALMLIVLSERCVLEVIAYRLLKVTVFRIL